MGGMSKSTARALSALGPQLFAGDGDILSPHIYIYTYMYACVCVYLYIYTYTTHICICKYMHKQNVLIQHELAVRPFGWDPARSRQAESLEMFQVR